MTRHVQLLAPLVCGATSFLLISLLLRTGAARVLLDQPNPRSLHAAATPRIGGLGIMAGFLVAAAVFGLLDYRWLAPTALVLAVSVLEDWRGVAAAWRLAAHLVAAGIFAWLVLREPGPLWFTIAVLAVAWMTNLYNFMDGADGLAGGMAVAGFGSYGVAAGIGGDAAFAALNFSLATAAAAFLVFNFHPARTFMGDAGSIPLGFLAAAFGILGWQRGMWPAWFPVLVFSPFILDASVTLAKRLLRGEKVWQAHRSHYYQRLIQAGWGHRRTALAEYGLMAACAIAALAGLGLTPQGQIVLLAAAALAYGALLAGVEGFLNKRSMR